MGRAWRQHPKLYPNRFWNPVEANEPFLTEAVALCDEALTEASEDGRLARESWGSPKGPASLWSTLCGTQAAVGC
jgi:hypothetical protein